MNVDDLKMMENLGLASKKECTKEENAEYQACIKEKKKLPDNIIIANDEKTKFFKIAKVKDDFRIEKLLIQQTYYTKIIKNIMVFVLAISAVCLVLLLTETVGCFNLLSKLTSIAK